MDWLVNVLSGTGISSIVGFAGGLASKWVEYKDNKAKMSYELKKHELSIEEIKLQQTHELEMADKQMQRAQIEGDIRIEGAELTAFTESQKTFGKAEGLLRYVRPAITFYMLITCTYLTAIIWSHAGGLEAFTSEDIDMMLFKAVESCFYLTTMCVAWWFGSRGGNIKK